MEPEDFHGLEPHQIVNLYQADDAPLADVRENALRKVFYWMLPVAVLLSLAAIFVKIPNVIRRPFLLKGGSAEYLVKFQDPVHLYRRYVAIGDSVKASEKLINIRSQRITLWLSELQTVNLEIADHTTLGRKKLAEDLQAAESEVAEAQVMLSHKRRELSHLIRLNQLNVEKAKLDRELSERRFYRDSTLARENVIPPAEYERRKWEDQVEAIKTQLVATQAIQMRDGLEGEISLTEARIRQKASKVLQLKTQFEIAKKRLSNRRDQILSLIENTYGKVLIENEGLTLLSPVRGEVTFLTASDKEIDSDQTVLKISETHEAFYGLVIAPPEEAPKLRKENNVVLKFDAFPHYTWGSVDAYIGAMSQSPDDGGNFLVRIELRDWSTFSGTLQRGSTGEAVFVTDTKNLYSYFFEEAKAFYSAITGKAH